MNTIQADEWVQDEDFWQVVSRPAYQTEQPAAARRTDDTGETPRPSLGQSAAKTRRFKFSFFH